MTQAKGKRIKNFKPCSLRALTGAPFRPPGCSMIGAKRIKAYGCKGYCASETVTMTNRKEFATRCTCCMATEIQRLKYFIACSSGYNRYHTITVISAKRCACRKCQPASR